MLIIANSSSPYFATSRALKDYPKLALKREGDINVGALLDIYDPAIGYKSLCSEHPDEFLLSKVFAMLYGINTLNANVLARYNLTLGYFILPTCSNPTLALMQAIKLVKLNEKSPLVAVIGPSSSEETRFVATYLSFYKIPQLSPRANAFYLNDDSLFRYLFRMSTDQDIYLNAMVKLVQKMGWTYYSIIYNSKEYFSYYRNQLQAKLDKLGSCLAQSIKIENDFTRRIGLNEYRDQFETLISQSDKSRLLFLFLPNDQYITVYKILQDLGAQGKFIFIALDDWPDIYEIQKEGLTSMALNTIMIFENNRRIEDYDEWMIWNKREHTPLYNDWLTLYAMTEAPKRKKPYTKTITLDRRLTIILDAVSTLGYALQYFISQKCTHTTSKKTLIKCINAHSIYPFIKNVSFEGRIGLISFNASRRSMTKSLTIVQFRSLYQKNIQGTLLNNVLNEKGYEFYNEIVGEFSGTEDVLKIVQPLIWDNQTFSEAFNAPRSRCTAPCKDSEHLMLTDQPCCWKCVKCKRWEVFQTRGTTRCVSCPRYMWPNIQIHNQCSHLPINFMCPTFSSTCYALVALIVLSMLYFIFLLILYVSHRNSRIFNLIHKPMMYILYAGLCLGTVAIMIYLIPFMVGIDSCRVAQFLLLTAIVIIFAVNIGQLQLIREALTPNLRMIVRKRFKYINVYLVVYGLITFQVILNVVYRLFNVLRPFKNHVIPYEYAVNFTNFPYKVRIKGTKMPKNTNLLGGYVEMACAVYPSTNEFFFAQIIFHIILVMLTIYSTIGVQMIAANFDEVNALVINAYTNAGLMLGGMFIYVFLDSVRAILIYLFAIYAMLFITLILQSYFKIKSLYHESTQTRPNLTNPNSNIISQGQRDN